MKPVTELDAGGVRAVLLDIDDTLTTDGRLTAQAYAALERLQRAGLRVVPVTGRPAGWCESASIIGIIQPSSRRASWWMLVRSVS